MLLTGRREWGVVPAEGVGARGAMGREWMLRRVGEGGALMIYAMGMKSLGIGEWR